MTTFFGSEKKCGCCGKNVSVTELGSTNACGSPDLDLRPPEMQRSAIMRSIQYCDYCGYAAWDLEECIPQTDKLKEILSESIDDCDDAQIFERAAKIAQLNGDEENVIFLYLCAAWCADDEKNTQQSVLMRKKILEICNWSAIVNPERLLQLIDIARRAGEFETAGKLLEQFSKCELEEPLLKKIAEFQKRLLDANDVSCYTIKEVEP